MQGPVAPYVRIARRTTRVPRIWPDTACNTAQAQAISPLAAALTGAARGRTA